MNLQIDYLKEEIIRTVRENSITIIEGNTGCGKSTKVPLFIAEAGYKVLVTQPRRLAAMSLAKRVSYEFGPDSLGTKVGFHTGLKSDFSENCQIVFLTDGTELIRQLNNKENLNNTVLILDEIHEWNINMDLLLAYAYKLIRDGVDLKLVLMSATMESNRLSIFLENAPIIKIPSKSYHITSINKPAKDLEEVIIALVRNHNNVLVFLPGKNEISTLEVTLQKSLKNYNVNAEVFPLHSDLPYEQQQNVLKKSWYPKVILSTNIAQTSITIPDIDAVVDTGLDKRMVISNGIPTLVLRNISQADIAQRKGRVGRCKPGIYYLCSDYDFEKRSEYSTPEIQCSNLENILLTLIKSNIDIGSLNLFHEPSKIEIENSFLLLKNLGAIDETGSITDIGKEMCLFPLNARASRILIESKKYGVEYDVLLCCLLQEFGSIYKNNIPQTAQSLKSDLIYQASLLKKLLAGDSIPQDVLENIERSTYNRIKEYVPKILSILKICASKNKINGSAIRKCLASGFLDQLYILDNNEDYINSILDSPRKLSKNSSLVNSKQQFIIGFPMDFSDTCTDGSIILKRLLLPTAFSFEEILECFSHLLTESYSMHNENIYKHLLYNEIEITSYLIGTIEDLKVSNPSGFHEKNEFSEKFNQHLLSLYYYNLKVSSKVV